MPISRGEACAIATALVMPCADSIAASSPVLPTGRPQAASMAAISRSMSTTSCALSVFGKRTMSAPPRTTACKSARP